MIDLSRIQRIPSPRAGGPGWRVELGREGATFPDDEPGGTLAALLRAVRWRDEAEGRAPSPVGWVAEGLERVDRGGVRGWWVSAVIARDVLDADLFEDEAHGGTRDALAAALAWRRAREGPRRRPEPRPAPPGGGAPKRRGRRRR